MHFVESFPWRHFVRLEATLNLCVVGSLSGQSSSAPGDLPSAVGPCAARSRPALIESLSELSRPLEVHQLLMMPSLLGATVSKTFSRQPLA